MGRRPSPKIVAEPRELGGREGRPLDLAVAGHVNLDHFLRVDRLPAPDRTVPVRSHELRLGGTAGNIARSAAAWGVRTALLARVGPDFPPEFRRILEAEAIDLRGLEVVAGAYSPACYIAENGRGGQSTLIDQGPMGAARGWSPPESLLSESRWLHATTGPVPEMLRLVRRARAAGVPVSADPAQEIHYRWKRSPLRELLRSSELFFGNESEITRGVRLLGLQRVTDLLSIVPLVIVTRGARGARAVSRAGTIEVPAARARRLAQVTGAGDAFRGGFYAGWFAGEPLDACLTAGARSARDWVQRGGPSRPPRRSAG